MSARTVVTGTNGTATTIYTAPPPPPPAPTRRPRRDNRGDAARYERTNTVQGTANIRLTPIGVILPPADSPTPSFTVTPTPVTELSALFDASASCGGATRRGSATSAPISSYAWTFGDGCYRLAARPRRTHSRRGEFTITLTVTNTRGLSASSTQTVTVGSTAPPTGDFVFSPTAPNVGDLVQFDADAVHAAPGHTIVQFSWNFGDPTTAPNNTASGFVATHRFDFAGAYTVVLSALDDAGQKTTLSHTVTVGTGNPIPTITFSPTAPVPPASSRSVLLARRRAAVQRSASMRGISVTRQAGAIRRHWRTRRTPTRFRGTISLGLQSRTVRAASALSR